MQRLLAALVLSVIGLLPVAPLFSVAAAAPQLPACCRAHGQHKCAMRRLQNARSASDAEPAIYALCDKYPFSGPASSTAVNPSVFLTRGSQQLFFAAIVSDPVAQEQIEARFRISFARSRQKRGPPSFLS